MAFFDFVNNFVEDNAAEIKAASEGAAAVWSIGSKLAGIAADMAVDTAKEAYVSLTEEEPAAEPATKEAPKATTESATAAYNELKALTKELKEMQRQNEALQRRLEELEAEKEAAVDQSYLDCEIETEDYYNSLYPEDEANDAAVVYENTSQREVVVKLAGFGEAFTVQAMNYLLNKYPSGANLPWVKVDQEERCVTVLRPEGGFAYIGDESVEEIL